MQRHAPHLFIALLFGFFLAPLARGDGGTIVLQEESGVLEITVFASPNPLRAGPVDLSVLVREMESRRPILDAQVLFRLFPLEDDSAPAISIDATHEAATNKLLFASQFDLPVPGRYELHVEVDTDHGEASVSTTILVSRALPSVTRYSFYLAFPFLILLLYVQNRRLVRRRSGEG